MSNAEFVPDDRATEALEPFVGTLQFAEVEMTTQPADLRTRFVFGRDVTVFPAAAVSFFTHGSDLVPTSQDVIRYGSVASDGRSYWDIIVQPGTTWSVPGEGGASRASFPFSLVHSVEGGTHNGVAMFAYQGDQISSVRFQITQQTAPWYVTDPFVAFGVVPVRWNPTPSEAIAELTEAYERSLVQRERLRPWSELEEIVGAAPLAGFDSDVAADDLVADGLTFKGDFYLRSCPSAAGALAYADRQRFGVWSASKSATGAVALLRLAQRHGGEVFDEKLVRHLPEADGLDGWGDVTFGNLLDMASGMGNGSPESDPPDAMDGGLDDSYRNYYEARSEKEKVAAVLTDSRVYPWGPGQVVRYRSQDIFMLGVGITRFLQREEGAHANVWDMLRKEVYEPIGIHYAPINRTIEPDGRPGQPFLTSGYLPTIGDLVKIGRLLQNHGRFENQQLLHAERLREVLPGPHTRGRPTGDDLLPTYRKGFWHGVHQVADGSAVYYPVMVGYGANMVPIFSRDVLAVRLAKSTGEPRAARNLDSLATVAYRLDEAPADAT